MHTGAISHLLYIEQMKASMFNMFINVDTK